MARKEGKAEPKAPVSPGVSGDHWHDILQHALSDSELSSEHLKTVSGGVERITAPHISPAAHAGAGAKAAVRRPNLSADVWAKIAGLAADSRDRRNLLSALAPKEKTHLEAALKRDVSREQKISEAQRLVTRPTDRLAISNAFHMLVSLGGADALDVAGQLALTQAHLEGPTNAFVFSLTRLGTPEARLVARTLVDAHVAHVLTLPKEQRIKALANLATAFIIPGETYKAHIENPHLVAVVHEQGKRPGIFTRIWERLTDSEELWQAKQQLRSMAALLAPPTGNVASHFHEALSLAMPNMAEWRFSHSGLSKAEQEALMAWSKSPARSAKSLEAALNAGDVERVQRMLRKPLPAGVPSQRLFEDTMNFAIIKKDKALALQVVRKAREMGIQFNMPVDSLGKFFRDVDSNTEGELLRELKAQVNVLPFRHTEQSPLSYAVATNQKPLFEFLLGLPNADITSAIRTALERGRMDMAATLWYRCQTRDQWSLVFQWAKRTSNPEWLMRSLRKNLPVEPADIASVVVTAWRAQPQEIGLAIEALRRIGSARLRTLLDPGLIEAMLSSDWGDDGVFTGSLEMATGEDFRPRLREIRLARRKERAEKAGVVVTPMKVVFAESEEQRQKRIVADRANITMAQILGEGFDAELGTPARSAEPVVREVYLKTRQDRVLERLRAGNVIFLDDQNNAGQTVLHAAAAAADVTPEFLRDLLATPTTDALRRHAVNLADNRGTTPLMLAVQHGDAQKVALLHEAGADVNQADNAGVTPLMMAARNGNLALVKQLLALKANQAARDLSGHNAHFYARLGPHDDELLKLLAAGV